MDVAAEMMSQEQDEEHRRERLRDRFILNWREAAGDMLFSTYETMSRTVDDGRRRPANQDLLQSHWDAKIEELEMMVKSAIADRCGS